MAELLLQQLSLADDFMSMRSALKQARDLRIRDPELVAKYGSELLSGKHRGRLTTEEVWALHEQVAVAALDVGNTELALSLLQNVHRAFPQGARASRLAGIYFEALGKWSDAEKLYKKELEKDAQNALMLKRLAAVKKGQGDVQGAAEQLKTYLTTQSTDLLAWEELADLYLQAQMYQQAAFCLEELLLHQPSNPAHHLLLADTLYTLGGPQNWRTARSYYSGVVELTNGRELRALYGVCACTAQLTGVRGGSSSGSRSSGGGGAAAGDAVETAQSAAEFGKLAGEALLQRYALSCPDKLPLVKAMLAGQGIKV
ncbi:hypothetical protein N2152v2_002950 [Parachlorella kessleri]